MSIKVGDVSVVQRDPEWMIVTVPVGRYSAPIPPPDPHAALKDAVVEAALNRDKAIVAGVPPISANRALTFAVDALLAAQRPPSMYAGLRKAVNGIGAGIPGARAAVEAELAKLEAEERT